MTAVSCLVALPSIAVGKPELPVADVGAARHSLESLGVRIGNMENRLGIERKNVGGLVAQARYFPIDRRLLDADLFFETGNHEKAATLYRDLVDNPEFKGRPDYYSTLYKLGESLFQMKNYITARRYFEEAADPRAGPGYARSIARLFEIAIRTRDFSSCERFENLVSGGSVASNEAMYAYGKYLYHRGRGPRAEAVFARVPAGDDYYARARYFLGVLSARSGRLEEAVALFGTAAGQKASTDRARDVRSLALLAQSRMLLLLGRQMEAVTVLQKVDTTSSAYPQTLFDMAWIYLQIDDLESAAHALDLLMMTGVSGELALKGGALRGRILTRLDDNAAATEAYEEVSSSLGPVTAELDRMTASPQSLAAYFDWVIKQGSGAFQMDLPVSESTAKWLRAHPDMAAMVQMFGDLSAEKEDVRKSFETADRLLWNLKSGGELITFPALKEKVLRLRDMEAGFIAAALGSADVAARLLVGRAPGEAGRAYERAVAQRRERAKAFGEGPQSYDDYVSRERSMSTAYSEVDRKLFLVESFLDVERGQVVAIEEWILDASTRGDEQLTPEREARIRASLDEEKRLLMSMHQELKRLKDSIQKDTLSIQSQTKLFKSDDRVRADLLKALARETVLMRAAVGGVGSETAQASMDAGALADRARKGAVQVGPLLDSVMEVARKGAAEFERSVLREKHRLKEAVTELKKAEFDSRAFARFNGVQVFKAVRDKLKDVLLEADLGLVDMAWQREQKVSEKLRKLGLDRAEKVRSLGRMEKMLKDAVEAAEAQEKAGKEAEIGDSKEEGPGKGEDSGKGEDKGDKVGGKAGTGDE